MPGIVGRLHERLVFNRRVRVLADHFAVLIPVGSRVLDVGCGDGMVDRRIMQLRPDVFVEGMDVLVRPRTHIRVTPFDGTTISYPDLSFDAVMFVDVLHHAADPVALLKEAARVGKMILVKDHFRQGFLAGTTLRLMDWVGNAHHGVALPYNYWSESQWVSALDGLSLRASKMKRSLGLYPTPASWIFDRRLHFVARFERIEALKGTKTVPQ